MPNFTTEDLLVYMYEEMEEDQSAQLELALQTDWALKQKYLVLMGSEQKLQQTPLRSPRVATVNAILRYAEKNMHLSN